MAIRLDEVFVLKRVPLRETSLIVTLFGRESGKFKVLAKGVRKEKNPLSARYEPFTHLSVVYYEKLKSDIHLASEATVIHPNSFLRERLDSFSYATYVTELIDALFGIHDPHPKVFDLLGKGLELFQTASAVHLARVLEFKLFEQAGFFPVLTYCVLCGMRNLDKVFFSTKQGGALCPSCVRQEAGAIPLSAGTLQSLQFFLKADLKEAMSLDLSTQMEAEIDHIRRKFLQFRLEYPLRSLHFLAELKPLLNST